MVPEQAAADSWALQAAAAAAGAGAAAAAMLARLQHAPFSCMQLLADANARLFM